MKKQDLQAIFIVAGHGGKSLLGRIDNGAVSNGTTERKEILEIVDNLIPKLLAQFNGISVIPVGYKENLTLNQKIKTVNKTCYDNNLNAKNSILISIHINAGGGHGVEGWYYGDDTTSRDLTVNISKELSNATGFKIRASKSEYLNRWGQLGIVHKTKPLACLMECGFLDSMEDIKILNEDDNLIALGITKGILKFLGEKVISTKRKKQTVHNKTWYSKSANKALSKKIITKFEPTKKITLAELVVILDRLKLLDK